MQVGFLLVPQRLDPGASPTFNGLNLTGLLVTSTSGLQIGDANYVITHSSGNMLLSTGPGAGVTVTVNNNATSHRFESGGSLLLGTLTNSSNGRLQLASHTTSAGGIGFGTDTVLYRSAAYSLRTGYLSNTGAVGFEFQGGSGGQHVGIAKMNNSNATVDFGSGTSTGVRITVNGSAAATFDTSLNTLFGGSVTLASTGAYGWSTKGSISSPSNGVVLMGNAAGTDFARLQFGGTTSSFPALKRSGAALQAVLADDSGYAGFTGSILQATSGIVYMSSNTTLPWRVGSGTPEGTVVASIGALYLRTDGGAGSTLYVKESGTGNTGWVAK